MRFTGHTDTFAEDRLPAPDRMPELRFELPELRYPQRLNAATSLLDARVAGREDARCLLAPGGVCWTYAELLAIANRIAGVLVDEMGLEPGNRVLLRAPNTPMLAACWYAVLKAGGIAVTTMPLYRANELRFMMEKAQVKHALCDVRLRADLESACSTYGGVRTLYFGEGVHPIESLEQRMRTKSAVFTNVETAAEDVAIIAFTSGTTGTPKAAMHYHRDSGRLLRRIRNARAAAAVERSLLRKPAAGVYVRARRHTALSGLRRRRDALARKGRPVRTARRNLDARRDHGLYRAGRVPRDGRASAGVRSLEPANVRLRGRDAAARRLGAVARADGHRDPRRDRQH